MEDKMKKDLYIKLIMERLDLSTKYPSHLLMAQAIYEDAKLGRNDFADIIKSLEVK